MDSTSPGQNSDMEEWWSQVQSALKTPDQKFDVTGQVVHRRRISKKLFFFDLRTDSDCLSGSPKLEVVVKYDEVALDRIASLFRSVHVGDRVRVNGWMEVADLRPKLFHCHDVETVERHNGQDPFIPEAPLISTSNQATSKTDKLCKYWLSTGRCQLGDECPFVHVQGSTRDMSLIRTKWINQRLLDRRTQSCTPSMLDPHSPELKSSSFHRARIFAEWILKTFGPEYLSSGTGVLDIAGGRGDVSFHLQTVAGVKCTLIEPRERKVNRRQKKILDKATATTQNSLTGTLSAHLRCDFDQRFIDSEVDLLQNASLLVGLHPDQVTELIACTAILHNKPFSIVPCCVFGHLFPNRTTIDGKHVVRFEDFVEYLKGTTRDVRQEFLNFEGRNLVLWKDVSSSSHVIKC